MINLYCMLTFLWMSIKKNKKKNVEVSTINVTVLTNIVCWYRVRLSRIPRRWWTAAEHCQKTKGRTLITGRCCSLAERWFKGPRRSCARWWFILQLDAPPRWAASRRNAWLSEQIEAHRAIHNGDVFTSCLIYGVCRYFATPCICLHLVLELPAAWEVTCSGGGRGQSVLPSFISVL